ncbi:MAG TPA: GNAT family N-acetyltransferase [Gemmatimonadaceae bacterium]|jgi:ribosomal protein S18 acetylase RimI-like enzyme
MPVDDQLLIREIDGPNEEEECAQIMATSEPWLTLGRTYDRALALIRDRSREVYVAVRDGKLAGFIVLNMAGAFVGYVQTVAVHSEFRGGGIGTRLIAFAEERIFRASPNVFMCVSSFNGRARDLYERLGYELVGELRNYIVSGYSEYLLRKTIAPIASFHAKPSQPD